MSDPFTCPRRPPDADGLPGERCNKPLPDGYGFRPCPDCRDDIQAAVDEANFWKCAKVAQALKDGYTIDPEDGSLVDPEALKFDGYGQVVASDRAGPPPSKRRSDTGGDSARPSGGRRPSAARLRRRPSA